MQENYELQKHCVKSIMSKVTRTRRDKLAVLIQRTGELNS